jgi:hypothetical protein
MVLLSAQGTSVVRIAEVAFTSEDRVRDVIHNFNTDGFDSYPKYRGGRPPRFTLPQRREIKKIAKSKPAEHGLPGRTVADAMRVACRSRSAMRVCCPAGPVTRTSPRPTDCAPDKRIGRLQDMVPPTPQGRLDVR